MVLRSTFDLRVPRGSRAAHISAPNTFWSFTRTSGATSDLLLVTGPTALPINAFVNRCVSRPHAWPPYDHRASARHRTCERGVSRTTLSKLEAPRAAGRKEPTSDCRQMLLGRCSSERGELGWSSTLRRAADRVVPVVPRLGQNPLRRSQFQQSQGKVFLRRCLPRGPQIC